MDFIREDFKYTDIEGWKSMPRSEKCKIYTKRHRALNPEKHKEYYNDNKEIIKEKSIKYYNLNKEYITDKAKINYNSNKKRDYYLNNKEKTLNRHKIYREQHKDILKQKAKIRFKKRLNNDPLFKFERGVRTCISNGFISGRYKKSYKTINILGLSYLEFYEYLESKFEPWMTWENKGLYNGTENYGWDIDHIIPVSSAKSEEGIIKLNYYTNLQPLCSHINRDIKSNKMNFKI